MMKFILSYATKVAIGLIMVAFVLIAIIRLIPNATNHVQPGIADTAYPPPNGTSTPTQTITPIPYPPPGKSENTTPTPIVTLIPTYQGTMPRPTEWPTNLPWPPNKITPQPYPTAIPTIFPTPVFQPIPAGKMPAVLQKLWYVYSPNSVSSPIIQTEQIDAAAQRWGKGSVTVDLGLSPNFPGPSAHAFFPSPDTEWIAANIAYGETTNVYIINSNTGHATQILPKNTFTALIAWKPDSLKVIVSDYALDPTSVAEVDISTGSYQHIDFPKLDGDKPYINTISYSPDGDLMADALAYQRKKGGRSECLLSIGITDVKAHQRKTIQEISSACGAVALQWSPDGHYLSWITQKSVLDTKLNGWAEQDELWISDRISGETKSLYLIGINVSRLTFPSWSPDGKKIAFVKFDQKPVRYPDGNIILIDPINGPQSQVSHFSGLSLSSVQWSSDGKMIFCNAFNAQYGTIWAITVENGDSFPVAGPVSPESPLAIMP